MPYALIVAVIEAELRTRLEKIFASFDKVPLLTASIGQVHAARLLSREEVVVKVQRRLVAAEIECDLAVLQELAREAEYHTPLGSGLKDLVDEFACSLRSELDYLREGQALERLRADLGNEPGIRLPRVHRNCTTRRVIVIERLRGRGGCCRRRSEVAGSQGWRTTPQSRSQTSSSPHSNASASGPGSRACGNEEPTIST